MRRNTRAVATLCAAGLLLTTGCGESGDSSSDETTLRVLVWGNNADITSIEEAAAGFSEAHSEIDVQFETGDCGVDYAACKTLIAGGTMADVFVTGSWNYFEAVNDGVLADLTPYLEADDDVSREDFTASVIDALTSPVDGNVYALPMGYNIQSLFYNKDMFAAAGLEEPPADGSYTYDDLREWAALLTLDSAGNNATSEEFDPDDIVQYGYFNFAAAPIQPGYAPVLEAFGGGILDGDLRNECTADDPETIAGFQWLQDLMWADHSAITPQLHQEEPGFTRWVRGQVAMQQGSHEQVIAVQEQNPELNYDMAALPAGPAGNATLFQIHTWAVYEDSEVKDAAWEFVKYMATEGSGEQMGLIPAYRDVAQGPDFAEAEGEPEHLVQAQLEPAAWDLAITNTDPSAVWSTVEGQDGIGPALDEIITGRATAEEALSGICGSQIEPILDAAG